MGEEALCIDTLSLSWNNQSNRSSAATNAANKCILFVGYRNGSLRKVELTLLSYKREDGGVFLSYREVGCLDLVKELRLKLSSTSGGDSSGTVTVRREVKAIPLHMKVGSSATGKSSSSVYLMTNDGVVVVDEVNDALLD